MNKIIDVNHLPTLIRWKQLKQIVPFSRITIWRWVRENRFPKPVRVGQRGIAWICAEIEQWISEQVEAR